MPRGKEPTDLTGQKFGRLTAIEMTGEVAGHQGHVWICLCDCGNVVRIPSGKLTRGRTKSCGCLKAEKSHSEDLTGRRFGKLTVLERASVGEFGGTQWLCKCDCGETTTVSAKDLLSGNVTSCGCARHDPNANDLTGQRFGRLTAMHQVLPSKRRRAIWLCHCDCGNTCFVYASSLVRGSTVSCGCQRRENGVPQSKVMRAGLHHVENTCVEQLMRTKLQKNNTSGFTGVSWYSRKQRWCACITLKRKVYNLGLYKNVNDAAKARKEAENKIYGDFLDWYAEAYPDEWAKIQARKDNDQ